MGKVVKEFESMKSQTLMTSLHLLRFVWQFPWAGSGGEPAATVPAKKRPLTESNMAITKSPASLARAVQRLAPEALPRCASIVARNEKAPKMSPLFSTDLP